MHKFGKCITFFVKLWLSPYTLFSELSKVKLTNETMGYACAFLDATV